MDAPLLSPVPLWRCPACSLKTRDVDVVRAHAQLPPSQMLGAHAMYAPPALDRPGMTLADLSPVEG